MSNNSVAGIWLLWTSGKGQYLTNAAVTHYVTSPDSLRDCMSDCVENKISTSDAPCRSIRKVASGLDCGLVTKRSDDPEVTTRNSAGSQYFNRPAWYLGI